MVSPLFLLNKESDVMSTQDTDYDNEFETVFGKGSKMSDEQLQELLDELEAEQLYKSGLSKE
jgi:hypothetical protein